MLWAILLNKGFLQNKFEAMGALPIYEHTFVRDFKNVSSTEAITKTADT